MEPATLQPPTPTPAPMAPTPQSMPPPPVSGVQPPTTPGAPAAPINPDEVYATICTQIIKEQRLIIGVFAVEQASHVPGLMVDPQTLECHITSDGAQVIEGLINQYRDFFGNAAVEVCKEAASRFTTRLSAEQLPISLR